MTFSSNYFEDQLRRSLASEFESGELRDVGSSVPVFERLMQSYPTKGSKIDWERVPNAVGTTEEDQAQQAGSFTGFFDEVCRTFQLSGYVIYVGDSATDFAVEGTLDSMRGALPEMLAIPQHHYFVDSQFAWCACLTMEGEMDFGYASP